MLLWIFFFFLSLAVADQHLISKLNYPGSCEALQVQLDLHDRVLLVVITEKWGSNSLNLELAAWFHEKADELVADELFPMLFNIDRKEVNEECLTDLFPSKFMRGQPAILHIAEDVLESLDLTQSKTEIVKKVLARQGEEQHHGRRTGASAGNPYRRN